MRRRLAPVLAILFTFGVVMPAAAVGHFQHLDPGGPANLSEELPVQFVFVGYDEGVDINVAEFQAGLPSESSPVVRSRLWYDVLEEVGIHYTFDYSFTFTDGAWEDDFFAALIGMATPASRTLFQDLYNDQAGTRDVGQNHFIDAPDVEKWLIDNAPDGVDTERNTVFFINWFGREDFIDHVYTKMDEPDPDTGFNFGEVRESRKIVAWGGTTPDDEETGLDMEGAARGENRVWFYDLSAGPEVWAGNFDITNADLDFDGIPDYRIPVAWEYDENGYRHPSELSSDLALVARYAAINLLFAASPLYPPYITPERQPETISLDLNTYEGWRGTDASADFQTPSLLVQELSEVHPAGFTVDDEDLPFNRDAKRCYLMWLAFARCFAEFPQYPGFANLFLYNALNRDQAIGGTPAEYEGLHFNYANEDVHQLGFLGFADDNWIDGTQSFVFNFVSPGIEAAGYGLTTTQIHEFGHHIGLSHPHDGYDSEDDIDYGPTGDFYFAWLTDEQNSMMSYIDLNWDFSQFDRDNMNRFLTAAYIRNANVIAGAILDSSNADDAEADLDDADAAIGDAEAALAAHDYVGALTAARAAYESVLDGADAAGVEVEASANGWAVLDPVERGPRKPQKTDYSHIDRIGPGTHRSLP